MAAAALTITACAEHDTVTTPTTEKPTATVQKITVSLDDAADTRAVNPAMGKKTFAEGDQIYVFYVRQNGNMLGYAESAALREVDISNGGKSATFSVGLETDLVENGRVFYVYPAGMANTLFFFPSALDDASTANSNLIDWTSLNIQSGKIDGSGGLNEHDLATFYGWLDGYKLPEEGTFQNQLAILELTVVDGTGTNVTATLTELKATIGSTTYYVEGADTDGKIYMALPPISTATDIVFTATSDKGTQTTDDDVVYKKTVKDVTLDRNTITPVTLTAYQQTVNLTSLTSGTTITLGDGSTLTGTLDGETQKVKVQIAAGATVTLDGVTINGKHYDDTDFPGAGINCLGDATIIVKGENTVKSFNRHYPAILAAHNATGEGDEYTLTIKGGSTDKLTATNQNFGAAIGGGDGMACGNILIEGCTITAIGNGFSAAIGGGCNASCGSITITGGTVTATGGGNAAGIGGGYRGNASCCDISISGTAKVTAQGGSGAAGIGSGGSNECGNITISGACTVIATGGGNAAGIGTGQNAKCGNISITGGTVTAQGGKNAAGIGCGFREYVSGSECGAITISNGIGFTSVTAIKGQSAYYPIGHSSDSNNNTCGTITFGIHTVYNAGNFPFNYSTDDISGLKFQKTTTKPDGTDEDDHSYDNNTWVLTPPSEE